MGVLFTSGLFSTIIILVEAANQENTERPLLVVDLMAWSAAVKQAPPEATKQNHKALEIAQSTSPLEESRPKEVTQEAIKQIEPEKILEPQAITPSLVNEERVSSNQVIDEPVKKQEEPTIGHIEKAPFPIPVPIFSLTQAPRFLHREMPAYPEIMRASGSSGIVKLEALIDKEGRVREASVVQSAGVYFDEAAKKAILASRFYPAKIGSEPVAVLLRVPVKFELL